MIFVVTGCGTEIRSLSPNGLRKSADTNTPEETAPPNAPEPPVESPGDDDKDVKNPPVASDQLCYSQGPSSPCYTLQDIDDVNQAEPMYNYVGPGDSGFPSGLDPIAYRDPVKLYFVPEVPRNTKVSNNFKRKEFVRANSTRGHYGFVSPLMIERVQALREHFGRPLKINSGYRSPGYNATLNGAARFSRHTYGDAIDFKINGVSFSAIAAKCRDLGAAFTQIYSSHIHCDWRTSPLEESVFGPQPRPTSGLRPLSVAKTKSMLETHSHIFASLVGNPEATKPKYKLSLETDQEDAGKMVHEWIISKGDEIVLESSRANPTLRLGPGVYQVYVKAGGYLEIQDEMTIE